MKNNNFTLKGNIVDISNKKIYPGIVTIQAGIIHHIKPLDAKEIIIGNYILPGFIDSHVHVESSMLVPSEFAKLAVVHGTVATISDPHEIANVCGIEGVEFMIENGKQVNFKFNFGAPSCVPATTFETTGNNIDSSTVKKLLERDDILYLSEMMNFPGVLMKDDEVMKKIDAAHQLNKPIDGHAPGLRGLQAKAYIDAGIYTDHECFTKEEAEEKLNFGMKILIREGSAAKNFDALIDLIDNHANNIMFCSDDKHPDSLAMGHINQLCARAIAKGKNVFNVLQAACINPVKHYNMKVGLLQVGDYADCIVVDDLIQFNVAQTYINGELVAASGQSFIQSVEVVPINQFNCNTITAQQLKIKVNEYSITNHLIPVIEALDGQLITNKIYGDATLQNDELISNTTNDILKMVVVNRYHNAPIAKCFIKNFGLKKGAIASSVAHDSHNIVAVGVDDESLATAINLVIQEKGGISAVQSAHNNNAMVLSLPIAGLMSATDGYKIANAYTAIDSMSKTILGSTLSSPFMTLSFMALLVIPHLKLSDKGLFDGDTFNFIVH